MASLNKALIIGNVGKDPEVVTFQDGSELAKFTLAATEKYTGRDGQQKSETEWFNIVAGGKLAAVVKQFVHKGSQVYVEGKFRLRTYQKKDGATGYSTEVQCMTLQLLGGAPQQPAQQVQRPVQPQYQQPQYQQQPMPQYQQPQYQQQPMPQRPPMPMPQKPVAPQSPQNPVQAILQDVQQAVENQQAYDADMPDWMR